MENPLRDKGRQLSDRVEYRLVSARAYQTRANFWQRLGESIAKGGMGIAVVTNALVASESLQLAAYELVIDIEYVGIISLAALMVSGYHRWRGECLESHYPNSR